VLIGIPRSLQTAASTIPDVYYYLSVAIQYTKRVKVLLEAPYRHQHLKNSVLLTVDLTKAVADEAITRGDSVIIAYRLLPTAGTQLGIQLLTSPRSNHFPATEVSYSSQFPATLPPSTGSRRHQRVQSSYSGRCCWSQ
jgi:hypothetical protein